MKKITHLLAVLVLTGGVGSANASLMPPVTVDGRDWLQPVDFINLSWNTMNSVCNATTGLCSGSLGGNSLDGWIWASVDDVNSLFNHYLGAAHTLGPGPDTFEQADGVWALAFFADGWLMTNGGIDTGIKEVFGSTRDTVTDGASGATLANIGLMSWGTRDGSPVETTTTTAKAQTSDSSPNIGAFIFRPVPSPGTLPLLGLSLAALAYCRRERKRPMRCTGCPESCRAATTRTTTTAPSSA